MSTIRSLLFLLCLNYHVSGKALDEYDFDKAEKLLSLIVLEPVNNNKEDKQIDLTEIKTLLDQLKDQIDNFDSAATDTCDELIEKFQNTELN